MGKGIKIVDGDLIKMGLNEEINVLVHGCNCFCTMNSGVAKGVREAWIGAWYADQQTVVGDRKKLGCYTTYTPPLLTHRFTVVNAYTQYDFGYDGTDRFEYKSFEKVTKKLANDFNSCKIALPLIGAGLAGGDWDRIYSIIEANLSDQDITIVNYKP